ncbi:MAG: hypothetical protein HFJ50_06105, partial [Clostridia bacterium]|nr:hypothetical protein [Clostridia bacterium]
CSSKTTTSMTIRARAYDNDSPAQTLTYKLYGEEALQQWTQKREQAETT